MKNIVGILFIIFIVLAILTIVYGVGSSIVKDYINNGLFSVVMSFAIGIPVCFGLTYLFNKIDKKISKKITQ